MKTAFHIFKNLLLKIEFAISKNYISASKYSTNNFRNQETVRSPDLINSLRISQAPQHSIMVPENLYLEKNSPTDFDSSTMPQMVFEVRDRRKFDSLKNMKQYSSGRTDKINFGNQESGIVLLGESDHTVGKKYDEMEGLVSLQGKQGLAKATESSEEGEDLMVGDSLKFDNVADSELPPDFVESFNLLTQREDELEAKESLTDERQVNFKKHKTKEVEEIRKKEKAKSIRPGTYLTLRDSRKDDRLSQEKVNKKSKEKAKKKPWRNRKKSNQSRKKDSRSKKTSKNHFKTSIKKSVNNSKSRSNSNIKLYSRMNSERNSAIDNNNYGINPPSNKYYGGSNKKNARENSKTRWKTDHDRSFRKEKLNKLYDRYSRDDNIVEDPGSALKKNNHLTERESSLGLSAGNDQLTIDPAQVTFSSTFGKNIRDNLKDIAKSLVPSRKDKNSSKIGKAHKKKLARKRNKEERLQKCKAFKHDKHANMFEVETLNSLIRVEEDYVAKPDYLYLKQKFLDAKVRTVLMGWMGEVCEDLWFCRDSFHMACNYVDRYLQVTANVEKDKLQLIGLTSLYISSKMEEVQMRCVSDYLASACNIYSEQEMKTCEIEMITKLDFKLNPPTLNLWANWYMVQWDNFITSDTFVQGHPLVKDSETIIQFKQGNDDSYNLYREFMQYLDCSVLDIQTLDYKQYMLIPSFMYIVLGMKYQQFTLEQIVEEFPNSSMYLLDEEEYAFNNLFGYFMHYYFAIELVDLLPTIQYASTYFYFPIELRLPSIIDYKREELSDVSPLFKSLSFTY